MLLAGIGYVIFISFPVRWAYCWIAKKSGSLDAGTPSAMMMTITVVLVFISSFYTDIIGIHAIFVSSPYHSRRRAIDRLLRVVSWLAWLFHTTMVTLSRW